MTSIDAARANVTAPTRTNDVPLEPAKDLPTPEPFRAGIGTWLGTAGAAAVGGVAGLTVGGVIGMAVDISGGGTGPAIAIGAGLIGLVGGGALAYHVMKSGHDKREHQRVQAEHGTSTLQYARSMMMSFDHDDDGQIDLVNSTGIPTMDERVSTEVEHRSRSHPKYDILDEEWRTETERWTETRSTSAAPVWTAADVDPKDDVVTDTEIARLMSRFDANRDGALTTPEQDAFAKAHPLITDEWRR